jgi:hypothetical protein
MVCYHAVLLRLFIVVFGRWSCSCYTLDFDVFGVLAVAFLLQLTHILAVRVSLRIMQCVFLSAVMHPLTVLCCIARPDLQLMRRPHESIRPVAVLDASNSDRVGLVHRAQRIPARGAHQRQLAHAVLAAVPVAAVRVAAVPHKLGEPVVVDAAVAAVGAPVLVELLHHVAGAQALVVPDVQEVEVEALDAEGGHVGAEGDHFAPGGAEAFDGVGAVGYPVGRAIVVAAGRQEEGLAVLVRDEVGVGVEGIRLGLVGGARAEPESVD